MAEVIYYALVAQSVVLGLMLLPVLRRRMDASTMLVVGAFLSYAAISFVWGAWALFGWTSPVVALVWVVLIALLFGTFLPFSAMTPRRSFRPRDLPVLVLSAAVVIGTIAAVLVRPTWFVARGVFQPAATEFVFGILFVALFVALIVFSVRWLRAPPGVRRTQIGYLLPGVLLTNLNDALGVARPGGFDLPGGFLVEMSSDPFILTTSLIRFVLIGTVLGVAASRYRRDRSPDAGLILFWGAAAVVLSWVSMRVIEAHHLVDGLAFVLIYYGIARFRIIDLDFRAYLSAGRSLAATTAIVIVFVVQQGVEQTAGTTFGVIGGALVAGIGLALLAPMQRRVEGLRGPSPDVEAVGAYDTYRRVEVYRAALAAMVEEGKPIGHRDATVLERMRQALDLSADDHAAILREVQRPALSL